MSATRLILASSSPIRRQMLEQAGLSVRVEPAKLDERALEASHAQANPAQLAILLATAKAQEVASRFPGCLVIGADQILEHHGKVLHKALDRAQAQAKLTRLQDSAHSLVSAGSLVRDGQLVWSGTTSARLVMRALNAQQIDAYLDQAGDAATSSVGAYRLEECGASLFEQIEGDSFTILGLPLLALLAALRAEGFDPFTHQGLGSP